MELPFKNTGINKSGEPLPSDGVSTGPLSFEDGPIEHTPQVLGTESYGKEDHMKTGWKEGRGGTLRVVLSTVIDSENIS